jgi:hypothetical protein
VPLPAFYADGLAGGTVLILEETHADGVKCGYNLGIPVQVNEPFNNQQSKQVKV